MHGIAVCMALPCAWQLMWSLTEHANAIQFAPYIDNKAEAAHRLKLLPRAFNKLTTCTCTCKLNIDISGSGSLSLLLNINGTRSYMSRHRT